MPATRSSGPPTAASFEPILLEAFENFKQKHSRQNQDLIHKNRLLLKTNAELERTVKQLKNENLDLRVAAGRAQSMLHSSRIKPPSTHHQHLCSDSSSVLDRERIRIAVTEIAKSCKVLEAALEEPTTSRTTSPSHLSPTFTVPSSLPIPSLHGSDDGTISSRNNLKQVHHAIGRAELIALRERRKSQLPADVEECRLSFINECSGAEDKSESFHLDARQAGTDPTSGPHPIVTSSSSLPGSEFLRDDSFVVQRSNRRQQPLLSCPESPLDESNVTMESEPISPDPEYVEADESNLCSEANDDGMLQVHPSGADDEASVLWDDVDGSLSPDHDNIGDKSGPDGESSVPSYSSLSDVSSPVESVELHQQLPMAPTVRQRAQSQTMLSTRSDSTNAKDNGPKKKRPSPLSSSECTLEIVNPLNFVLSLNAESKLPKGSGSSSEPVNSKQKMKSLSKSRDICTGNSKELRLGSNKLQASLITESSHFMFKRRDSGFTKATAVEEAEEEAEGGGEDEPINSNTLRVDEGWDKKIKSTKKRSRPELDAVREEQTVITKRDDATEANQHELASLPNILSDSNQREARRARKEVNYALPSLVKKMRRPEEYDASTKRSSTSHAPSKKNNTHQHRRHHQRGNSAGATPSTIIIGSREQQQPVLDRFSSPPREPILSPRAIKRATKEDSWLKMTGKAARPPSNSSKVFTNAGTTIDNLAQTTVKTAHKKSTVLQAIDSNHPHKRGPSNQPTTAQPYHSHPSPPPQQQQQQQQQQKRSCSNPTKAQSRRHSAYSV